jgi:hypothetical protein
MLASRESFFTLVSINDIRPVRAYPKWANDLDLP